MILLMSLGFSMFSLILLIRLGPLSLYVSSIVARLGLLLCSEDGITLHGVTSQKIEIFITIIVKTGSFNCKGYKASVLEHYEPISGSRGTLQKLVPAQQAQEIPCKDILMCRQTIR